MSCNVCIEPFNRSDRVNIICPKCEFNACKLCYTTFLVDQERMACCMNCKNEWDYDLLTKIFPKTFLKRYKETYKEIFFRKESALFSATQPLVEDQIKRESIKQQIKDIQKKIEVLDSEYISTFNENNINFDYTLDSYDIFLEYYTETKSALDRELSELKSYINEKISQKNYIKKCPNENCKGFLNEAWKCMLCNIDCCSKCHVIKQQEHVCKDDDIATANLLSDDTKCCPNCKVPISKINGCDQMFCMQCHTPFSWKSGKIENGRIHNPHYLDLIKNGELIERDILDIRCGRMIDLVFLDSIQTPKLKIVAASVIIIRQDILPDFIDNYIDNSDIRIKYLRSLKTEQEYKNVLFRRYKSNEYKKNVGKILSTYVEMITEILYRGRESTFDDRCYNECCKMLTYTNSCLVDISKRFDCKPVKIF